MQPDRAVLRSLLGPEGQGRENCWAFFQLTQQALLGRAMAEVHVERPDDVRYLVALLRGHEAHRQWRAVDRPSHGSLVELSHSVEPHHIGTWLDVDGGGLLHCTKRDGGCFDSLLMLKNAGWRRLLFYDWIG